MLLNCLRVTPLFTLMAVAISAHAKLVQMPPSDGSASQFVEDSKVSRTNNIVTLKFINELSAPYHVSTKRRNYSYASQTFTASFDCMASTYRIEDVLLHSGSMGAGQVYPGQGVYKWRDLSDGYPMWRTIWTWACKR